MTNITHLTSTGDSARAVRNRYRQIESSAARWRLLTDAASALASEGSVSYTHLTLPTKA